MHVRHNTISIWICFSYSPSTKNITGTAGMKQLNSIIETMNKTRLEVVIATNLLS